MSPPKAHEGGSYPPKQSASRQAFEARQRQSSMDDPIHLSERGEVNTPSSAAHPQETSTADQVPGMPPSTNDGASQAYGDFEGTPATTEQHFLKWSSFATYNPSLRVAKIFPDDAGYLLTRRAGKINEQGFRLFEKILANDDATKREELELQHWDDMKEYYSFLSLTHQVENMERPANPGFLRYLRLGNSFMECEDPGFFHSPENWVCLGRTDRRRQLTERYLYTVPGLAYVVQKYFGGTQYAPEGAENEINGPATARFIRDDELNAVVDMASRLLFALWVCVPLGLFSLVDLSPPVQTALYLLVLMIGFLALESFFARDSQQPAVFVLAYGAVLGTAIFNSN